MHNMHSAWARACNGNDSIWSPCIHCRNTKSPECTSFRAPAYTKILDFTRNLSKLRVISRISFDLQIVLPVCANLRHKLRTQTAKSHDPFNNWPQNRHFRGRPVQGDRQETSKFIHIIFEGRKISYVSAKFYIFGNSGPSRISSVCQTFQLDGKEID